MHFTSIHYPDNSCVRSSSSLDIYIVITLPLYSNQPLLSYTYQKPRRSGVLYDS